MLAIIHGSSAGAVTPSDAAATFSIEDVKGWTGKPVTHESRRLDGYCGIWFTLGKMDFGPKYSGGLGTYTSSHVPMAVYSPEANKTFFTYGGTTSGDKRELAIMISYYDHATGKVPKPVLLYLDPSVNDPHDNASICVDQHGIVWVFKSGRNTSRPGLIFRSAKPYSIDAFELVAVQEFTYPQITLGADGKMFLLFTKYTIRSDKLAERNLFWKTSTNAITWSEDGKLAGFGGHYQTSGRTGNKVATFFNWHPNADADARTNVYYAQTVNEGKTWTTADGKELKLPLDRPDNAARISDLHAVGKLMYTCDLNFDQKGNPILLFVCSGGGQSGPKSGPREWTVMHWKGGRWLTHVVTQSDHNYDMGSLYVKGDDWRIIGPTQVGPQPYGTGGEIALWTSRDEGNTWKMEREVTSGSLYNNSYVRRPMQATDPFYAFWADGNPFKQTESHLYFTDSTGGKVRRLPYVMQESVATPEDMATAKFQP
jgi:hypothetical protein